MSHHKSAAIIILDKMLSYKRLIVLFMSKLIGSVKATGSRKALTTVSVCTTDPLRWFTVHYQHSYYYSSLFIYLFNSKLGVSISLTQRPTVQCHVSSVCPDYVRGLHQLYCFFNLKLLTLCVYQYYRNKQATGTNPCLPTESAKLNTDIQ